MTDKRNDLVEILKMRRVTIGLSCSELAAKSGVSLAYIARIEKGERFPSARVLRKLAEPLGFREDELYIYAGYLSPQAYTDKSKIGAGAAGLDPYVAKVLSEEPVEMQRKIIGILSILKSIAKVIE